MNKLRPASVLYHALLALALVVPVGLAHGQSIQDDLDLFEEPPQPVPGNIQLPQTPTSLHIGLGARPLRVIQEPNGVTIREDKNDLGPQGRSSIGEVGSPDVSQRIVDVLLPFDADLSTLHVEVTGKVEEAAGTFSSVRPISKTATTNSQTGNELVVPVEGIQLDGQGRNTAIYSQNKLFPGQPVEVKNHGQMRQYKYVRLAFSPYRWNPVTGNLVRLKDLQLDLSWLRATIDVNKAKFDLSDPVVMGSDLAERFLNVTPAQIWYTLTYQFRRPGSYDYIIITTSSIRSSSTMLDDFVTHKESMGYSPYVVSVEAIDLYYTAGSERADRMRLFLQDKYADWGIENVLLIGDPNPYDKYVGSSDTVGNVPMKMAWPRGDGAESWNSDDNTAVGCPTDHYYGDLSDNWDVDGDGWAAAFDDDYDVEYVSYHGGGMDYTLSYKVYGIDFDMEVRVGRIGTNTVADIDTILDHTINYENWVPDGSPTDRNRVYMATSMFANDADYSYMGRDIHDQLLAPAGLTVKTLYDSNAHYTHDIDLDSEGLINTWTGRGAGLVIWAGHGSSTTAKVWKDSSSLMNTGDIPTLDFSPRSFVFEGSCRNGWPESSGNMANTLLKYGAMTTVAGTRNSYYSSNQHDFGTASTIGDVGYWVARCHARSNTAGYSIKYMRSHIDPFDAAKWMQNALTYNLYGDPTVKYKWN